MMASGPNITESQLLCFNLPPKSKNENFDAFILMLGACFGSVSASELQADCTVM